MMVQDVTRRSIGINFDKTGKAEVSVWAPEKKNVELIVNDNKQVILKKGDFGYWHQSNVSMKPGDRYKYRIDDKGEFADPASLYQPDGVHGHSQVVDLHKFSWEDGGWENIPLHDYIIYELHTGTFTEEGTFK